MNFLNQLRPSNAALMQLMNWELTADGAMLATCRNGGYSKKALENLFDRKWTVASGVALIGIAITLIAVIGSVWGGVVLGTIGSAILIHRLFKRPDILTNLRVDPWLVNILKEDGVKKLPIVRDLQSAKGHPIALRASKAFKTWCDFQYPGGKDITVYIFQYKLHKLDGEKLISEELFYHGDNWDDDPNAYTSVAYEHRENQMIRYIGNREFKNSQLAHPQYLHYFGEYIANPLKGDITGCYQDVVKRIADLCSGERLSLLENRRQKSFIMDLTSSSSTDLSSSAIALDIVGQLPQGPSQVILSYLNENELAQNERVSKTWRTCIFNTWSIFNLTMIPGVRVLGFDASMLDKYKMTLEESPTLDKRKVVPFLKQLLPRIEDDAGVTVLTLPKGLSIDKMKAIAGDKIGYIWNRIQIPLGAVEIPATCHLIMGNNVLKESRTILYEYQEALAESCGCQMPSILAMTTLTTLTEKVFGFRLFTNPLGTFSRCAEFICGEFEKHPTIVDRHNPYGCPGSVGYRSGSSQLSIRCFKVGGVLEEGVVPMKVLH